MTKRPFLHKWFTNGEVKVHPVYMQEEIRDRASDEDGAIMVRLDCDEDCSTIDPNDPYLN